MGKLGFVVSHRRVRVGGSFEFVCEQFVVQCGLDSFIFIDDM